MSRNPLDASSTSSTSDPTGRYHAATYLCRRCPGMEVLERDREAHRLFHIEEDMEAEDGRQTRSSRKRQSDEGGKAKKPGPKSKTQRRSPSPAPSSLFTVVPRSRSADARVDGSRQLRARTSPRDNSPRGAGGGGASPRGVGGGGASPRGAGGGGASPRGAGGGGASPRGAGGGGASPRGAGGASPRGTGGSGGNGQNPSGGTVKKPPVVMGPAEAGRLQRAIVQHYKYAPGMTRKFNGA